MKVHTVLEPQEGDLVHIERRACGITVTLRGLVVEGPAPFCSGLYVARMPEGGPPVYFMPSEMIAYVDRAHRAAADGLADPAKTVYSPQPKGGPDERNPESLA